MLFLNVSFFANTNDPYFDVRPFEQWPKCQVFCTEEGLSDTAMKNQNPNLKSGFPPCPLDGIRRKEVKLKLLWRNWSSKAAIYYVLEQCVSFLIFQQAISSFVIINQYFRQPSIEEEDECHQTSAKVNLLFRMFSLLKYLCPRLTERKPLLAKQGLIQFIFLKGCFITSFYHPQI